MATNVARWFILLGPVIVAGTAAAPQTLLDRLGVKHTITATVAPLDIPKIEPQTRVSDLKIAFRVSDHAREAQFFGELPISWADFLAADGAPVQTVWADKQCHQRRGLPTATIMTIEGNLDDGRSRISISASHRRTGRRLPGDEIRQAQALQGGRDDNGQYFTFRTETVESHVVVFLKIYEIDCLLN